MSSSLAMSAMGAVEFVLSAVLCFVFWRRELQKRFPTMGAYLVLRVVSTPVLLLLFSGNVFVHWQGWLIGYFYVYWAVYIASAVLLFFICMEVFRSTLATLPGLMGLGIAVFRWAVAASAIICFSTISFAHRGILIIPDIADRLMRSVSILELCLLGFLCASMNALCLSTRDTAFGISLGFGLMSVNDFVLASLISVHASLTTPLQFVHQSLVLVSLGVWAGYCLMPEPARRPITMPANSIIYRWNEIASALGHTGTQVAVRQPAMGFFMADVDKAVEKVLKGKLKNRESES